MDRKIEVKLFNNGGGSRAQTIERKQYTPEFKREAVRLIEAIGLDAKALKPFPVRGAPVERSPDEELARLRREHATLHLERDVLKAITIFAEPRPK